MRVLSYLFAGLIVATVQSAYAEVQVSKIFSSDMVLQRDKDVIVWGSAANEEKITVTIAGQTASTTASDGKWKVSLKVMKAGGPHDLQVTGSNTLVFKNILIGDVWLCGGQSNMDFDVSSFTRWPGEIGQSYSAIVKSSPSYQNLRVVLMKKAASMPDETSIPVEDDPLFQGKWQTCTPEVTARMSATGFVFAQRLQAHLDVPIGMIDANKGGSPVQTWYAPQSLKLLEAKSSTVRNMYNAMIRPYRDLPIKGVIWYQGESNARTVESSLAYEDEFKAMISGWRHDFQDPGMPFLFVQLAAYERNPYQHGITYPVLRDSQTSALDLKNTGMAVAIDLGDPVNIHPPYKLALSDRLVLAARKVAYGENLVFSGPIFKEFEIKDSHAEISFDHIGSGLEVREVTLAGKTLPSDKLKGFQIAGSDKQFHDAEAVIDGSKVLVSSPAVKKPLAVRYAYRGFPYANLYNQEGLPASPFRTDAYEIKMDQDLADLQNRRLYLPRSLSRIVWTIEQKRKVAVIHDKHITKDVEKKILEIRARYTKLVKAKGKNSPEFKNALEEYNAYLNPLLDKIGAEVSAANIIEN